MDIKPVIEINITKEVGAYDEQMTTNMLLGELAQQIREAYVVVTPAVAAEGDTPATPHTVSIHAVIIDPTLYGDLRETEWMYKDLNDESDPDNAQVEGEDDESDN
jgi:hypothetical protein